MDENLWITSRRTAGREVVTSMHFLISEEPRSIQSWLSMIGLPKVVHVVVDAGALTGDPELGRKLAAIGQDGSGSSVLIVKSSEKTKSWASVRRFVAWFDDCCVARRSEPVIVVGGGALLDAVSFAASIYRRGVTLVKVPTTLVGIVDAALGAKCGVNFFGRKNLIGTYYPPSHVLIDCRFLTSLPQRHLRAGTSEMLKVAIARSPILYSMMRDQVDTFLDSNFQTDSAREAIHLSSNELASSIWADVWENTLEREMDFGHSLSKTFEEHVSPRLTHGDAVALDMSISLALSNLLGLMEENAMNDGLASIKRARLPTRNSQISTQMLESAFRDTQIHRDGSARVPLPGPLGHTNFVKIGPNDLSAALDILNSSVHAKEG